MLRPPGLIAVCACFITSVGCDGGPSSPTPTVKVDFGGQVVNADTGSAVGGVRVSLGYYRTFSGPRPVDPTNTATSAGDGTFTLPLNLPVDWRLVSLDLTGPPGYDDRFQRFDPATAALRPAIRVYPTLVIRPGESIDVSVDSGISAADFCYPFRRVLVAASPGESVDLELVSHDSSKPMALSLAVPTFFCQPDLSVRRLIVPPGGVPTVYIEQFTATGTLTARR